MVVVLCCVPAFALSATAGTAAPPALDGCLEGDQRRLGLQRDSDVDNVELDGEVIVSDRVDVARPVTAGETITCLLTIRSRHPEPATFQLETFGVVGSKEPNAELEFIDDGDDRFDATAGDWLEPIVDEVTIEPRGVVRVPVVVTVPDDPPVGSAYGSVNVVSRTRAGAGDTALGIETQLATVFLLRVGGDGRPELTLRGVDAPRLRWDRDAWRLTADLDNDGTLHATASGRVRVRSIFGTTVAELPIRSETILPKGRQAVDVRWKGVPWLGFYRYDVRVENGPARKGEEVPDDVATASGWFIALPPWWVLAIVAAALIALMVRWWRNRGASGDWDEDELGIEDHELGG